MKPQSLSSDNSLIGELEGTIRERLKQVWQAAIDAMVRNGIQRGHRILISKAIERRNVISYYTEDPIRTMMFLGSWSHT
ncbi:hypothetical protein CRYUN_Cryun01aG0185200 [Craigia yunnanensis]